jgi:hemerythrin-like metal-binding protein
MPNRVTWDPRLGVDNETIDEQHKHILARIDALAVCLGAGTAEDDRRFLALFDELKTLARDHFAAEEALLARNACPRLDEHRHEQEEYNYLQAEIVTAENFDKAELQTFLSLWWAGHIAGNARDLRPWLEQQRG